MAVEVRAEGGSFSATSPRGLMKDVLARPRGWDMGTSRSFDLSPDRGTIVTTDQERAPVEREHDTLVLNWFGELKEKVPGG